MVSTYQYISVAMLESLENEDYSARSVKFTDAVIESNISKTEMDINTFCDRVFTGTIPDGVKSVCLELSARRMYNLLHRLNPKNFPDVKEVVIKNDEGLWSQLLTYISSDEENNPVVSTINLAEDQVSWGFGI